MAGLCHLRRRECPSPAATGHRPQSLANPKRLHRRARPSTSNGWHKPVVGHRARSTLCTPLSPVLVGTTDPSSCAGTCCLLLVLFFVDRSHEGVIPVSGQLVSLRAPAP